jgi:hypothetical protein
MQTSKAWRACGSRPRPEVGAPGARGVRTVSVEPGVRQVATIAASKVADSPGQSSCMATRAPGRMIPPEGFARTKKATRRWPSCASKQLISVGSPSWTHIELCASRRRRRLGWFSACSLTAPWACDRWLRGSRSGRRCWRSPVPGASLAVDASRGLTLETRTLAHLAPGSPEAAMVTADFMPGSQVSRPDPCFLLRGL